MKKIRIIFTLVMTGVMLLSGCAGNQSVSTSENTQKETVTEAKTQTINTAGTYTGEYDYVEVISSDTILENVTADRIVVTKEVGDGDVTLRNVQVSTLEVYGGGENSIHLVNSAIGTVISHKEEGIVRIVVESETNVASFDSTNTRIEVKRGAVVEEIIVKANTAVIVEEEAKAETITVADETAEVSVAGEVKAVAVAVPRAAIVVEATATVSEVTVKEVAAEAKLTINGTVKNLTVAAPKTEIKVEESATVSEVKVEETATETVVSVNGMVDKVTAQTPTVVEGTGKVTEVQTVDTKLVTVEQSATAGEAVNTTPAETTSEATTNTATNTVASDTTAAAPTGTQTEAAEHVHTYTSSYDGPTCTESGGTTYICTSCYDVYSEDVPAKGHSVTTIAAVAPTCTTTGLTAGSICSECNEVLSVQQTVDALGHTVVTDAAVEATCTATGLTEGKHCSVCNEVFEEQTLVLAKGHTRVVVTGRAATCTATGLTDGEKCSVCNEVLTAQEEIAALGHTEEILTYAAPTCTATGLKEGKKCSVCNEVLTAQEEIPATGHTAEAIPAVAAACTTTGLTEGSKCKVCGDIIVAQNPIDALGHVWTMTSDENGHWNKCTRSGCTETADYASHTYNTYVCTEAAACTVIGCDYEKAANQHTWGAWSETADGTKHQHTCQNTSCNVTETKDHSFGAWSAAEDGERHQRTCTVCPKTEFSAHVEEVIPAVEATCTTAGATAGEKCSDCGVVLAAPTVIPATGHSYNAYNGTKDDSTHTMECSCGETLNFAHDYDTANPTNVTAATCTTEGAQTITCKVCNGTKQEVIPVDAAAHKYGDEWIYHDLGSHKKVCAYDSTHIKTADHVRNEDSAQCSDCPYYFPGTAADLAAALETALTGGSAEGTITITISRNFDLTGWTTINGANYSGVNTVVIDGNGYAFTNMDQPFIEGVFGGSGTLTFKNLTIKDSTISAAGRNDVGIGVFMNNADSSSAVMFENCKIENVNITNTADDSTLGGFVGYSSAATLKFTNCSVKNSVFTGTKDIGAFVGYTQSAVTATDAVITGNTITSSNTSTYRVGAIAGTFNVNPSTITTTDVSNNTITQANAADMAKHTSDYAGRIYADVTVDGTKLTKN